MPVRQQCVITKPSPELIAQARDTYGTYGLVTVPDVVDVTWLRGALRRTYEEVSDALIDVRLPHTTGADGVLSTGHWLSRLDPLPERPDSARIRNAFATNGIDDWTHEFATACAPWFGEITSYELTYDRAFVLVYREGDYIAAHGDLAYEGHRVNLQIALPYDTVSCMRVLQDGYLRCQYDHDGTVRALGTRFWHEVPPLLRLSDDRDPLRLVLTMRMIAVPTEPGRAYHGQQVRTH